MCTSSPKNLSRAATLWSALLALLGPGCDAHRPRTPLRYDVVRTGLRGPKPNNEGPTLVVLRSEEGRMRVVVDSPQVREVPVDWSREALLWVTSSTGGNEQTLQVVSLTRDPSGVQLLLRLQSGAAEGRSFEATLDVEAHPWILIKTPSEAFDGIRRVRLEVQGEGSVEAEGRAAGSISHAY